MREIILKVTLKVDDDISVADAKEYALDALESMGGCRHPEDPFFSMQDRVKVVSYRRPKAIPSAKFIAGSISTWTDPRFTFLVLKRIEAVLSGEWK